jgi:hypothetical protein
MGDAAVVGGVEERDYLAALKLLKAIQTGDLDLGVNTKPQQQASDPMVAEIVPTAGRIFDAGRLRNV